MTLTAPVPASAQAIGPDLKAKPLSCASQVLPLPRRVGGPRYGEGAAESQDWEQPSPRRKLWSWPAVASTPSTPIPDPPCPCPSSQLLLEPHWASLGRWEDEGRGCCSRSSPAPTHPPPRERGGKHHHGPAEAAAVREQEQRGRRMQGAAQVRPPAPGPPSFLWSFYHPLPARESLGSKPCQALQRVLWSQRAEKQG